MRIASTLVVALLAALAALWIKDEVADNAALKKAQAEISALQKAVKAQREEIAMLRSRDATLAVQLQQMQPALGDALATRMAAAFNRAADKYQLDPQLLVSVAWHESRLRPISTSYAGARGIMQVMPFWVREIDGIAHPAELHVIEQGIEAGAFVLRHYVDKARGDLTLALLYYNRGPAAVAKAYRMGVSPRNGYAAAVLRTYKGGVA